MTKASGIGVRQALTQHLYPPASGATGHRLPGPLKPFSIIFAGGALHSREFSPEGLVGNVVPEPVVSSLPSGFLCFMHGYFRALVDEVWYAIHSSAFLWLRRCMWQP